MTGTPTWYLLFGGSSEDGQGPGVYAGRTTARKFAQAHLDRCHKDHGQFSTGYVQVVTDDELRHVRPGDKIE